MGTATIRAYFTPEEPDEANGNTVEAPFDLALYHCDGAHWAKFGGAAGSDANGVYVEADGVNAFSPFVIARGSDDPTGVDVAEFSARVEAGRTRLHWVTANELDIQGFHLYGAPTNTASPARLTRKLIVAAHVGAPVGAAYTWDDPRPLEVGAPEFYWLEVVSAKDAARYGPVVASMPRLQIFLPALVRQATR
ncbi:MAG: hypothetical protein IPK16_05400 [Anaerolineales bacterium]|nr:hypothetical protein [Anaerolineales bacterium]